MIKVVVFDADGVLINGARFSTLLDRDYGISIQETLPFFTGPFQDCLIGKADLKETLTPYLPIWRWGKGVEAFLELWFQGEHTINEELINYIQKLRQRGILCFLATDNEKYRFQYILDKMSFSKSFDKTFSSAHLGMKKTNQDFFLKILNQLDNTQKNEVLFIDDDMENIQSAKDFGMNAEFYTSFEDFKEKMKQYIQF